MPVLRHSLERLSPSVDGLSRYLHPHGYVIEHTRRSWSERGRPTGRSGHDPASPLYWWTVWNHLARRRPDFDERPDAFRAAVSDKPLPSGREFPTLADAREWCDEHPREGWTATAPCPASTI